VLEHGNKSVKRDKNLNPSARPGRDGWVKGGMA
jgi:hypothetical protein